MPLPKPLQGMHVAAGAVQNAQRGTTPGIRSMSTACAHPIQPLVLPLLVGKHVEDKARRLGRDLAPAASEQQSAASGAVAVQERSGTSNGGVGCKACWCRGVQGALPLVYSLVDNPDGESSEHLVEGPAGTAQGYKG